MVKDVVSDLVFRQDWVADDMEGSQVPANVRLGKLSKNLSGWTARARITRTWSF